MHISLADFILNTETGSLFQTEVLIWLASCFFPRRLYERSLHICASFHINILPPPETDDLKGKELSFPQWGWTEGFLVWLAAILKCYSDFG